MNGTIVLHIFALIMGIIRVLKYLLIAGVVLLIAGLAFAIARQDAIGTYAVNQLNQNLKEPAEFGQVSLSFFSNFPFITAGIEQVSIPAAHGLDLLHAEKLDIVLGLRGLFTGQWNTRKISIKNAWLNIHFNEQGDANYLIWDTTEDDTTHTEYDINWNFNNIEVQNLTLDYRDARLHHHVLLFVEEGAFSGSYHRDILNLKADAAFICRQVMASGSSWLEELPFHMAGTLQIDLNESKTIAEQFSIRINDSSIKVQGEAGWGQDGRFDLTFSGDRLNIRDLLLTTPPSYVTMVQMWESEGNLTLQGRYHGRFTSTTAPELNLNLSLENGSLRHPGLNSPLKKVILQGNITLPADQPIRKGKIDISQIRLMAGNQPFSGNFTLEGLDKPVFRTRWNGEISTEALLALLQNETLLAPAGMLQIKDLSISGSLDAWVDPSTPFDGNISGSISSSEVAFRYRERQFQFPQGTIVLHRNQIDFDGLHFVCPGINLVTRGSISRPWPYLLQKARPAGIALQGNVQAALLQLDELLETWNELAATESDHSIANTQESTPLLELLTGSMDVSINAFSWNKVETQNWTGKVTFSPAMIGFEDVRLEGMDGQLSLAGSYKQEPTGQLELAVRAYSVNATELFRQCEDFGQQHITHRHVSGALGGRVWVKAVWDAAGNFDMHKLEVLADLQLQNGRIRNVEMFESFANYARLSDLKNIEIVSMNNILEFSNLTFRIPAMFIQNNAMNITLSGEHLYDHRIDYQVAVNAGQIALNRMNPFRNAGQTLPASNGGLILFYRIYGTTDNYQFTADRSFVQNKFQQSSQNRVRHEHRLNHLFQNKIPAIQDEFHSIPAKIDNFDFLLEAAEKGDDLEYIDFDD